MECDFILALSFWGGVMAKRENEYQSGLIKRIKTRFPGCEVLKNDEQYIQGIPDLTVLTADGWALLETKRDANAKKQPNQDHYVKRFNDMSFSAFIHPSNEEDVLDALQRSFEVRRKSCDPEPE
jgi:hypothetical protein